jgi:site-specific recombinase XerD
MTEYQDCPDYLKEFLFYILTIRGRSKRTVEAYHIDLRTFLRYINAFKS